MLRVIETFPILYKRSSKGKAQQWVIEVVEEVGAHGAAFGYRITHGYVDGKQQDTITWMLAGKNIGKANETTPCEQATSEAHSKWQKQKDKGYRESIQEVDERINIKPMLAHEYEANKHKVGYPVFYQPKLDGIRCLAFKNAENQVVLLSRGGKFFNSVPHIARAVAAHDQLRGLMLDGELYIHNESFQDLTSAIRKDNPTPESAKIEYHVYDCYCPRMPDAPFSERTQWIKQLDWPLVSVQTGLCYDEKHVSIIHEASTKLGYEGLILRNQDGVYRLDHRSYDLLKVKKFVTQEFEIVGGKEGKGKSVGQCIFTCKTEEGAEFSVRCDGSDEQRRWQWEHLPELIGKHLTVKFFAWTTSKVPTPRFPVGISIRELYE